MPPRRKSTGRRSEPKLFRCTYNNTCNMVFTRSEHLARHERKHTGEKPFQCVVPGCDRMFSRFDNMMQHTQTHTRSKRKSSTKPLNNNNHHRRISSSTNKESTIILNEKTKKMKSNSIHHYHPLNQHLSSNNNNNNNNIKKSSPPPPIITNNHMIESRTLPPPTRRASFSHFPSYHLPVNLSSYKSSIETIPSNNNTMDDYKKLTSNYFYSSITPPSSSSSSSFSSLPSPLDGFDYQRQSSLYRRGSLSTVSSSNDSQPSLDGPMISNNNNNNGRRRLSAADLQAPIQSLQDHSTTSSTLDNNIKNENPLLTNQHETIHPLQNISSPNMNPYKHQDTIDISTDEYEALQGFSKFSSQRIQNPSILLLPSIHPTTTTNHPSPIISAQVHAFRQKLLPIQESFQRPVRNT